MHIENLNFLQDSRIRGLIEEFERDIKLLEDEFELELDEMAKNHVRQVKELKDMIETVKDEEKKKAEEAKNEH